MIKDFRKTIKLKRKENGQFFVVDILQLPHSVISNSEKLSHPIEHPLIRGFSNLIQKVCICILNPNPSGP